LKSTVFHHFWELFCESFQENRPRVQTFSRKFFSKKKNLSESEKEGEKKLNEKPSLSISCANLSIYSKQQILEERKN